MPNRLDQLHVAQVHAVDKGANGRKVLLRKAAGKKKPEDMAEHEDEMPDDEHKGMKAKMKKAWTAIQKAFGYGEPAKAMDFDASMERTEARREADKMMSEFWDCHWALRESLESILADDAVPDKRVAIAASLQQFLDALAEKGLVAADHVVKAMESWGAQSEPLFKAGSRMAADKKVLLEQVKTMVDDLFAWASPQAPAASAADTSGEEPVAKKEGNPMPNTGTPATPAAQAPVGISKADFDAQMADVKKAYDAQLADLKKQADDAVALAKAEKDKRETADAIAKAEKDMGHLPGMPATELGPILKALHAGEPLAKEQVEKVETVLKASSEAIEKGELLKEFGAGGSPTGGNAYAKIEGIAKSYVEKGVCKSMPEAITKAIGDNPALYAEHVAEKAGS